MKSTVITIFLFLYISKIFGQTNDSLVLFTKSVEWNLFKGMPNSDTLGASIATSIHLEIRRVVVWNGILHFKAYALMNPSKSWVKPGYADQYTLQHEQTHFNLTEICARGLQTELNKMKIKSKKSPLIQATFIKWQHKLEGLHKEYDLATKGGNDHVAQNIWNEKIIAELIATDLY